MIEKFISIEVDPKLRIFPKMGVRRATHIIVSMYANNTTCNTPCHPLPPKIATSDGDLLFGCKNYYGT